MTLIVSPDKIKKKGVSQKIVKGWEGGSMVKSKLKDLCFNRQSSNQIKAMYDCVYLN